MTEQYRNQAEYSCVALLLIVTVRKHCSKKFKTFNKTHTFLIVTRGTEITYEDEQLTQFCFVSFGSDLHFN